MSGGIVWGGSLGPNARLVNYTFLRAVLPGLTHRYTMHTFIDTQLDRQLLTSYILLDQPTELKLHKR